MGKNVDSLLSEATIKESKYRRLKRFMESEEFIDFVAQGTMTDEQIAFKLRTDSLESFRDEMRLSRSLFELSTAQLRRLGSKHGIKNYSRLQRHMLIKAIKESSVGNRDRII